MKRLKVKEMLLRKYTMSYFLIKEKEGRNHNCKPVQDSRSGELSGPGVERKQAFQSFDANLEFNMETNDIVHR